LKKSMIRSNHMSQIRPIAVLLLSIVANGEAAAQAPFEAAAPFEPGMPPIAIAQSGGGAVFVAQSPRGEAGLLSVEPFESARPVLNAPYTADAVTEVTQVLADGNRIEHQTSVVVARDSRGRIRREHQALFFGGVTAQREVPLVTISDPSSGTHVTLDPEQRAAHRMSTGGAMKPGAGEFRTRIDSSFPGRPVGAAVARSARIAEAGADVRTEELGVRDIEGVKAEGTRTTMTIPAGRIGNQAPIEVVSERWYSRDLQVVVMTRRSDPRFGETIYRLTNIVRGEPSPELFEVPQGYRVETPALPKRPRR
jgi:hypothetical protein